MMPAAAMMPSSATPEKSAKSVHKKASAVVTAAVRLAAPVLPVASIRAARSCHPSPRSCRYRDM